MLDKSYWDGDDWIVIDRLVRMVFAVNQMPVVLSPPFSLGSLSKISPNKVWHPIDLCMGN